MPAAFDKERKGKILEFALLYNYLKASASEGCFFSKNTFEALIGKLVKIEADILHQQNEKKKTEANAIAIKDLQEHVADEQKGKRIGGGNQSKGTCGHSTEKGDILVNKGGYYLYGTCNKKHSGPSRKLKNTEHPRETFTPNKKWMSPGGCCFEGAQPLR